MYKIVITSFGTKCLYEIETESLIPMKSTNSDYQAALDAIIADGADCFNGDIPADVQAAANAKAAAE